MEPWEALDLDYSDVHSLLHPLKRHRSPQPPTAAPTPSPSLPLLQSCSRPPSQSHNHRPDSDFSSQSTISRSQRVSTELEVRCSSGASSRLIPGPAGAVQAAMQRRTRGDNCFFDGNEEPVPTQEYIRRVIENGHEEDDDFKGSPWLCALDFVRGLGAVESNGAVSETPLSSIKNGFNADKVALVVAMIKSCTSNGLGGVVEVIEVLSFEGVLPSKSQDPTGTIDASIHHRVISEGDFGKDLTVGAVLLLQKVALFSPTRFVHVLNVTSNNVIKVISKDSGPPTKHNNPTAIRQPDSTTGETNGKAHMTQKNFDVSRETTQNIMNNLRKISKLGENGLGDQQTEKENAASSSICEANGNNRNQYTVVEKDVPIMDLGISKETLCLGVNTLVDQDQETGLDEHNINHFMDTDTGEPSQAKENDAASNNTQVPDNQEAEIIDKVKKTVTRIQGPRIPQWTDEQLDELFVFD